MKMELWIRSQSREKLVKVNEIKYEEYKNVLMDYPIAAIIINDKIVQEYKSKERALEILDEIQHLLQTVYVGSANRIVYQMPED